MYICVSSTQFKKFDFSIFDNISYTYTFILYGKILRAGKNLAPDLVLLADQYVVWIVALSIKKWKKNK